MFHDSGKLNNKKHSNGKKYRSLCLHCGYTYGEHIGQLCPSTSISDNGISCVHDVDLKEK